MEQYSTLLENTLPPEVALSDWLKLTVTIYQALHRGVALNKLWNGINDEMGTDRSGLSEKIFENVQSLVTGIWNIQSPNLILKPRHLNNLRKMPIC